MITEPVASANVPPLTTTPTKSPTAPRNQVKTPSDHSGSHQKVVDLLQILLSTSADVVSRRKLNLKK